MAAAASCCRQRLGRTCAAPVFPIAPQPRPNGATSDSRSDSARIGARLGQAPYAACPSVTGCGCRPCRKSVARCASTAPRHRLGPQQQHVDAAVGHAVVAQRPGDPPGHVPGAPRLAPRQDARLELGDDAVRHLRVEVAAGRVGSDGHRGLPRLKGGFRPAPELLPVGETGEGTNDIAVGGAGAGSPPSASEPRPRRFRLGERGRCPLASPLPPAGGAGMTGAKPLGSGMEAAWPGPAQPGPVHDSPAPQGETPENSPAKVSVGYPVAIG